MHQHVLTTRHSIAHELEHGPRKRYCGILCRVSLVWVSIAHELEHGPRGCLMSECCRVYGVGLVWFCLTSPTDSSIVP